MYHLPSKARFSEESLNEERTLITYHNEKQILYQFYGINLNNNRKESEHVNKKKDWLLYAIVFVIGWCIGELLMKL